ncbi:GNAT family N-acetyltransferase [Phytoactinopolyspora halotolerans]|uniref:N-acetyltransferase n=1 Tax=Phytoactinopolyspora halotolerans TaxID=1981512 RepID=A0A6L9SAR2_9ACTN|nr:GNAT family N-acetyltransferase [Phytoactinopolyspora halotolerans]NEE01090.1 N-acetyltransferase [Phytoactinopolyspora halotolerans]
MDHVEIIDNLDRRRFEIYDGADLAGFLEYRVESAAISLIHTQIDPHFQGKHLAGRLVRHVLDEAQGRGLAVLPWCPFVRDWIIGHPAYVALVPESRREEFGLTEVAASSDSDTDGASPEY